MGNDLRAAGELKSRAVLQHAATLGSLVDEAGRISHVLVKAVVHVAVNRPYKSSLTDTYIFFLIYFSFIFSFEIKLTPFPAWMS